MSFDLFKLPPLIAVAVVILLVLAPIARRRTRVGYVFAGGLVVLLLLVIACQVAMQRTDSGANAHTTSSSNSGSDASSYDDAHSQVRVDSTGAESQNAKTAPPSAAGQSRSTKAHGAESSRAASQSAGSSYDITIGETHSPMQIGNGNTQNNN